MAGDNGDFWVFGYGSLMWRPGFAYAERQRAVLRGYRRALCVFSHVHRGTPETPGLVLGLDRGGTCRGLAFRVPANGREATLAYLRAREQATAVYVERYVAVTLEDGRRVTALTFAVDRRHPQYAGSLKDSELLAFVRQGIGQSGPNPEYILATHALLDEMGVSDPVIARLAAGLRSRSERLEHVRTDEA